jgi:SAM-dependent methyltransferase
MLREISSKLFINSSRYYLDEFAREAAKSVQQGIFVLDAGSGNCPYKSYFSHTKYESADFCQVDKVYYGEITYICDLMTIPVENNRFDLVFCSQVLEHTPEPAKVLKEIFRVLKPGGALWLTTPLFYEEHEAPYDFYRYTQYGLKYLLEEAGFSIKKISWLEGYYGTLAYQLRKAAKNLPMHPKHYGKGIVGGIFALIALPLKPLFAILSILFSKLDLHAKYVSAGQCKNYAIIAVKL